MSNARFFIILLTVILVFSLTASVATAAEKKGSPFKDLVLRVFGYTKKTVEKEVTTVGEGIKKGADIVVEEVKDVGELVTGDTSKAKDVLVKPITGTTEMVGETAHGVITAPIEAGKEIAEEEVK